MKFLDLDREYSFFNWKDALAPVFKSKFFINGPQVEQFEDAVAEFLGVKHAIGVSSGTDALQVAFLALRPKDQVVLTTPYTFIATTEMPIRLGAKVIFCDIDETFNMDTHMAKEIIRDRHVDILLLVHLFGKPCISPNLLELCKEQGIIVIEDCAQAFGAVAESCGGECMRSEMISVGAFGLAGCFSFFPAKNLGCAGDGGLLTTNDAGLAKRFRTIRNHGSDIKYMNTMHGGNFRLDTLQSSLLLAKLPYVRGWVNRRRKTAQRYNNAFRELPVICPGETCDHRHAYHQYVLQVEADIREGLRNYLKERDIPTAIYYPRCLSEQPCYVNMDFECDCINSRKAAKTNVALPIAYLTPQEVDLITNTILEFYHGK